MSGFFDFIVQGVLHRKTEMHQYIAPVLENEEEKRRRNVEKNGFKCIRFARWGKRKAEAHVAKTYPIPGAERQALIQQRFHLFPVQISSSLVHPLNVLELCLHFSHTDSLRIG